MIRSGRSNHDGIHAASSFYTIPRLPKEATAWERRLAAVVHNRIYLLLTAILVTGFGMARLAPTDTVVNTGAERILDMTARFSFARDAHEFFAGLFGWLFGAHLISALWHRFARRDGLMQPISVLKPAKAG